MNALDGLYQELILDHAKARDGFGSLSDDGEGGRSHQRNPVCGDEITLQVRLTPEGTIRDVVWDGAGCSISQASASMLAGLVEGLDKDAAAALIARFREALRSRGTVQLDEEEFGDAAALNGVSKFTARVKCAMLAWVALEDALTPACPSPA